MHHTLPTIGLALASIIGVAASGAMVSQQSATPVRPAPVQDQLERYRTQMANMGPQSTAQAMPADPAIASAIAQWRALRQTDALPFDSYAGFMLAHPGWPGEAAMRRTAERKAGMASPGSAAAFFRRFPAQTGSGAVAQARALAASGAMGEANEAARLAWRRGVSAPEDEAAILGQFGSALTTDDHDARMDALLWARSTAAAARQIGYVSAGRRAGFQARLALRSNAPDAAVFATTSDPALMGDAGYVADRAAWLNGSGAAPTARSWLAQQRALTIKPGAPEAWFELLLANARAAAADGQWQVAYDIARQIGDAYAPGTAIADRPYGERDDYTSLAWLGGQAALKRIGRPADAMILFERYAGGSNAPQTRSKGYYWAGRAAEAAGRSVEAAGFYARAADYPDQYHGILAAERSGRALTPPPPVAAGVVTPEARAAWDRRDVVRATRLLNNVGDWKDQSLFVRQVALDAKTDSDHALALEMSRTLARPDLAVMIGRSARANGLPHYAGAGFPTVPVPTGYEGDWTLIHAIARQESQFDRAAVSAAGARGLMQLMPGTAREQTAKMGMGYDLAALTTDPMLSIRLGSSYFGGVYERFNSYPMAIAGYNAGGGNVNKWIGVNGDPRTGAVDMVDWIEAIPFSETRNYVQRVLENAVVYDLMNPARARSRGPQRLSWYLGRRAG